MNTIIFRTVAPFLAALMIMFSIFVLLRGHNEPGGGFIGGLIAASAIAIYGISSGVTEVRKALVFHPITFAGFGVFIAALSGFMSLFVEVPFLKGLWLFIDLSDGTEFSLSTPMLFDIGVYFVVLGAISTIALALEEDEDGK
ncbi:Na+/H+ antiporter subunit B [Maritalea sp.]|jgi:multicomponent Na+:H+ antiporter subunit B|uniref:Na+/H+ antiporter subunit B n=1 Tax=Maritalea sp. TaxID=2003361 RepID=UPI0039E264D0